MQIVLPQSVLEPRQDGWQTNAIMISTPNALLMRLLVDEADYVSKCFVRKKRLIFIHLIYFVNLVYIF